MFNLRYFTCNLNGYGLHFCDKPKFIRCFDPKKQPTLSIQYSGASAPLPRPTTLVTRTVPVRAPRFLPRVGAMHHFLVQPFDR